MKIIYVDVDTLRPDHTGPYGYPRDITPNLDEMARESVVFDNYYVSDSPCLPSRTALTSGQFGITNGVVGHFGDDARFRLDAGHAPRPGRPLLGQALAGAGYLCASVSSFAERHRAYFFHGNFRETMQVTPQIGDEPANLINDAAIEWIEKHREVEDWYVHLTYWEPHTDYLQDPCWAEKAAAAGPVQEWPDQQAIDHHVAEIYGPRSAVDLHYANGPNRSGVPHNMPDEIRTRADFEHLINGYDGAICFWDHEFGRLRRALDAMGLTDEVAIVVSADHGEAFGELGMYAEHGMASEPVHHVPMIVFWPGVTNRPEVGGKHCDALLYNIDYAPTILDLLGIERPAKWQGRSFGEAVRGADIESQDHLVWGHGAHSYQRAVRTRDHLYIRTYHPGSFRCEWESLFDVTKDRFLTENLIEAEPELANQMRSHLLEWWSRYAGTPGALPDPMQGSLQTGPTLYNEPHRYAQHLRDTGRAHLADDLLSRLAPDNGATHVSWHAQEPLPGAERAAMRAQFARHMTARHEQR